MDRDDSGGADVLHDGQENVGVGAALARRAAPRVVDDVGRPAGVGILVVEIGGGEEELIALGVGGRSAHALVHVAAADPLRRRRHPDLVAEPVVADDGAHGVGAVAVVVAGYGRVGAAAPAARVDGVVPVVVVVAGAAAVLVDEGGVVPEIPGVLARDDGAGAGYALGPDVVGVDESDVPLDGLGCFGILAGNRRDRIHPHRRVGVDVCDIVPFCHGLDRVDPAADPDHVGDPVGAVLDAERLEFIEDRALGSRGELGEGAKDIGAFGFLACQTVRRAEIGLFGEKDEKSGFLGAAAFENPGIDLVPPVAAGRAGDDGGSGRGDGEGEDENRGETVNHGTSGSREDIIGGARDSVMYPGGQG